MSMSFGWCLTSHHGKCPSVVDTWGGQTLQCGCKCHSKEVEEND